MSRVKHIKRADRGYRNNTHYQTRAMLHSTHRVRQHNAAYSQTARRPAKPLVRAHLRKAVNKAP